ncbi:MAG: WYL domain-containing protein [Gammaproteobacteria bacterium]|nr:WYL domain-containing protein [Gammaproteobacteria bacterium]MBT8076898.1 WYL domain-containing protein [Gammaproteobacteria bacterium]
MRSFSLERISDQVLLKDPDQKGHYDGEGAWTLELPFSSPRELVMDILRYGPEVEVVEPPFLRDAVAESARRAAEIYS